MHCFICLKFKIVLVICIQHEIKLTSDIILHCTNTINMLNCTNFSNEYNNPFESFTLYDPGLIYSQWAFDKFEHMFRFSAGKFQVRGILSHFSNFS